MTVKHCVVEFGALSPESYSWHIFILSVVLLFVEIAPPPSSAELLMKLLVPLKLSTVRPDVEIAPPLPKNVAPLSRKVVFPVNVRLLSDAMIPPPGSQTPATMLPHALLCVNSVFPDRVMLVLFTASAV